MMKRSLGIFEPEIVLLFTIFWSTSLELTFVKVDKVLLQDTFEVHFVICFSDAHLNTQIATDFFKISNSSIFRTKFFDH